MHLRFNVPLGNYSPKTGEYFLTSTALFLHDVVITCCYYKVT